MEALSIDQINQVAPYRVGVTSNGVLFFKTKNDIVYNIGFEEDNPLGGSETYQFYINSSDEHAKSDSDVRRTVTAIVSEFFAKNTSVILYVCDTSDGRQHIRDYAFHRWFTGMHMESEYTLLSGQVKDEGIVNYISLIVPRLHPRYKEICADFNDTIQMFNSEKPE